MAKRKLPFYILRITAPSSYCRGCGQILSRREEEFTLCEKCFERFPAERKINLNKSKIEKTSSEKKMIRETLTIEEIEYFLYGRRVTGKRKGELLMKF